jgi:hypothetical protein
MRTVTIKRGESTDHGTFGELVSDAGFRCLTGELPDRNNEAAHSCIPKGQYMCKWAHSPKYGMCYHVTGVHGRSDILIHPANLMGDVQRGFVSQLLGCIALGAAHDTFQPGAVPHQHMTQPQKGISGSKKTVGDFVAHLGQEDFLLVIE